MATRVARTLAVVSPRSPLTYSTTRISSLQFPLEFVGHTRANFASSFSFSSSSCAETELNRESSGTKQEKKKLANRLSSVFDAINDRKLPPELRGQRNTVRSETDITNVVEQRIWRAMEEGHFDNLPGKGKPLNLDSNPHADPAEDTLYRILSKNGFAPEWIELNKEIRSNINVWRSALKKAQENSVSGNRSKWIEESESLKSQMRGINDKVFRYNLIAPFGRQMFGLNWEKELDRLKQ